MNSEIFYESVFNVIPQFYKIRPLLEGICPSTLVKCVEMSRLKVTCQEKILEALHQKISDEEESRINLKFAVDKIYTWIRKYCNRDQISKFQKLGDEWQTSLHKDTPYPAIESQSENKKCMNKTK